MRKTRQTSRAHIEMKLVSDRRLARHPGEGDDSAFSTHPTLMFKRNKGRGERFHRRDGLSIRWIIRVRRKIRLNLKMERF